jgi:hypothetical protein
MGIGPNRTAGGIAIGGKQLGNFVKGYWHTPACVPDHQRNLLNTELERVHFLLYTN